MWAGDVSLGTLVICRAGYVSFSGRETAIHQRSNGESEKKIKISQISPKHAWVYPDVSLGHLVICRARSVMFNVSHFMWDTGHSCCVESVSFWVSQSLLSTFPLGTWTNFHKKNQTQWNFTKLVPNERYGQNIRKSLIYMGVFGGPSSCGANLHVSHVRPETQSVTTV